MGPKSPNSGSSGTALRCQLFAGRTEHFAIFPVLDWIATLTTHIPNKGEQLVRYYGYYSSVSRGKRDTGTGLAITHCRNARRDPLSLSVLQLSARSTGASLSLVGEPARSKIKSVIRIKRFSCKTPLQTLRARKHKRRNNFAGNVQLP